MAMGVNHAFCWGHVKSGLSVRHLNVLRCLVFVTCCPEFVGNINLGIVGSK